MDRELSMLASLPGAIVALAIFFPLGAKRRAWIPPLAWWLFLGIGVVIFSYGLSHATAPSFAKRITTIGNAYDCIAVHQGRDSHFQFRLEIEGRGSIYIETLISLPGWGPPIVFNGRTLRVVYLEDTQRTLKNEGIDIEVLSGRDAGAHDSLDARPFGKWLGIPLGAAVGIFGFVGLRYMKDDADAAAQED